MEITETSGYQKEREMLLALANAKYHKPLQVDSQG